MINSNTKKKRKEKDALLRRRILYLELRRHRETGLQNGNDIKALEVQLEHLAITKHMNNQFLMLLVK